MSFWFGDFELDQERRQLLRSGEPVPLEPRAYELLSLLVERRPRALSRAQIRDVVWPQTFVSESTLAVVVNGIRHALGDDARQPRFIRTVHGFGYAFCGEAREVAEERPGAKEAVERPPYPGLLAFTEADAEHFFGREAEVEVLWEKIRRQNPLAVIGPSGVGKTSFLRAGLFPHRPSGWSVAYLTPGASPALSLARALISELAGDAEAIGALLQGVQELSLTGVSDRVLAAVRAWRKGSTDVLVVVDQFEELFALNTPEVQARFASLLGRLEEEADVRVLLSLRDDFLFRCGEQDVLRPVFKDLTPLYPPSPAALRRALVEPAEREGYRFEDDTLVDEMVEAVEGVKGALPLLAFAVARLWDERNRERKLLTREAYARIEGVAGAVAQHAEATLSRLGPEREGIVREIFRNLVTAQGTRAAADPAELISVFGERREEAGAVLDGLVDARLLTEYEPAETQAPSLTHRRIEIVHESLLTHWPRLVRWRTQDADGAQLRDQLRQTAHLWDERGRPDDLLWTGTSYLDYGAWRARYAGGLSTIEEAFAQAMTALANRRRRRRRFAFAAVMAVLTIGLGVVVVLWGRAEIARRQAAAEALRAEGSKLLALAQVELESFPTAALAYATRSLELADTEEARRFVVRVLQDAPTSLVAPAAQQEGLDAVRLAFDSKGEWLGVGGYRRAHVRHRDGRAPVVMEDRPATAGQGHHPWDVSFGSHDGVLVANRDSEVRLWSVPDGREIRRLKFEEGPSLLRLRGDGFFLCTATDQGEIIRSVPLVEGKPRLVGTMGPVQWGDVDETGAQLAYSRGRSVYVHSLEDWASSPRLVASSPVDVVAFSFHPDGRQLAASDKSGEIRIWPTSARSEHPLRVLEAKDTPFVRYSPGGRWLAAWNVAPFLLRLWDLGAPRGTGPLELRGPAQILRDVVFDPSERWMATSNDSEIALWPLGESYPRSMGRHEWFVDDVAFTSDGTSVVTASGYEDGTLRTWPISVGDADGERLLLRQALDDPRIAVDPRGDRVAVSADDGPVFVMPLEGGTARRLDGFSARTDWATSLAFSPDGRLLAAAPLWGPPEEKVIRVWDLARGACQVLGPLPGAGEGFVGGVNDVAFVDGDHIVASSGTAGLLLYDRRDGTHRVLSSRPGAALAVGHQKAGVIAVLSEPDELVWVDLRDAAPTRVFACPRCTSVALDPTDTVVATGSRDGIVRIGPASGGEPHLFFGRNSTVQVGQQVAFSPDGRWVASSGERPSVRLWPVPDVTRTPLHRRSRDEVLATLHSWTNLRAVKDPQSPTGWKLEAGPFPGWANLPHR